MDTYSTSTLLKTLEKTEKNLNEAITITIPNLTNERDVLLEKLNDSKVEVAVRAYLI